MPGNRTSTTPRQQPGAACEECRQRKLRCDRRRPKCGTCSYAGIECQVVEQSAPRGPKRGSLDALRSRILNIEERLRDQQPESSQKNFIVYNESTITDLGKSIENVAEDSNEEPAKDDHAETHKVNTSNGEVLATHQDPVGHVATLAQAPGPGSIPSLMRIDLDQLYFDRVHPTVPMLERSRYFSWNRKTELSESQTAMQYAMWTLAMSQSSQFEVMRENTYTQTRSLLEALDHNENESGAVHLEQVQAWILLANYEFLRSSYRRAWMSAGRVFRLVQLLRLYEIDRPNSTQSVVFEEPQIRGEKRRTFWVAYCLDRLISLSNGFPLTLSEELINTWLPSLESELLGDPSSEGIFLSEAIVFDRHGPFSPLAECVIMLTMYGRVLTASQLSSDGNVYGGASLDFWSRYEWLDDMVTQRMATFSLSHPSVSTADDPMVIFAFMVMQATIICICTAMDPFGKIDDYKSLVAKYQTRALHAAREIARFSKDIECFKAHVFLPVTISIGARWLMWRRNALSTDAAETHTLEDDFLVSDIQACMDALRNMREVSNLAKQQLQILEAGENLDDVSLLGSM